LSPVNGRNGGAEIELGPLQRDVLDFVWDHPGCSVRECRDYLEVSLNRPYAYTTIQTVFDTLNRKGLLSRTRRKNVYYYKPIKSRASLLTQGVRELMQRFGATTEPVASSLVDALEGDPIELNALIAELQTRGHLD
jgi:predicted transcriptional regulator